MSAPFRALAFTAAVLFFVPTGNAQQEIAESGAETSLLTANEPEACSVIERGRFNEVLEMLRPLREMYESELGWLFLFGLAATEALQ